jgi:hypothetical protein
MGYLGLAPGRRHVHRATRQFDLRPDGQGKQHAHFDMLLVRVNDFRRKEPAAA